MNIMNRLSNAFERALDHDTPFPLLALVFLVGSVVGLFVFVIGPVGFVLIPAILFYLLYYNGYFNDKDETDR